MGSMYNQGMDIKKTLTDKERIEFAKQIEYMFEATHAKWHKVAWLALLRGIFMGFGVVIGGSILVAILIWILGNLESIPLLGDLAETAKDTVKEEQMI